MLPVFGNIEPPDFIEPNITGITDLTSRIVQLVVVIAGLYAFINLILAGYQFISGGGDPQKVTQAWAKIYQTLIGLIIIAGSVLLTMIISLIIFGEPGRILYPIIYGPD